MTLVENKKEQQEPTQMLNRTTTNLTYAISAVVWDSIYISAGIHVHESVYSPQVQGFQISGRTGCRQTSTIMAIGSVIPSSVDAYENSHYLLPVQSYIENPISQLVREGQNGS